MSEKRWFVTVGVPGGEIACRADVWTGALALIAGAQLPVDIDGGQVCPFVREAPPELVDWLNADMWTIDRRGGMKVPGGWRFGWRFGYGGDGCATDLFVPVALAGGITVIGEVAA